MWEDDALWATMAILVLGCLCISLSIIGTFAAILCIAGGV